MNSNTEFEAMDNLTEENNVVLTQCEYDALLTKVKEAEELAEKYLRLLAEFENYKKFMERQKAQYLKYGNEKLLKEIIKLYDDLKRALKEFHDSQITQGLKLILNNFSAILKNEGIAPIEAEGREFDPCIHEAMLVEQNPSLPEGAITEVLEDGYYLNGKVLRPSKVKINKINE